MKIIFISDRHLAGSVTSIAQHVCAIDDVGMKCWGINSSYQLGSCSAGALINGANWSVITDCDADIIDRF